MSNDLSIISNLAGPATVINLARRSDRRVKIEEHLKSLNIAHRIFAAVNGSEFSNDDPKVVNQIGFARPKSTWQSKDIHNKKARVGCSMSHLNVVMEAKTEKRKCALILEDDARFSDQPEEISKIAKTFKETWENLPEDCDMLMLGANHRITPQCINERVLRCTGAIGGHAYIVFESYYDRFIKLFEENFARIGNPDGSGGIMAQDSLLCTVQSTDKHYAMNPLIATQIANDSDIFLDAQGQSMEVDYTPKLHHLETFLPYADQLQPLLPNNPILEVWDLSYKGRSSCKIFKIIYSSGSQQKQGIVKLFPESKKKAYLAEVSARKELEELKLDGIFPVADLNPQATQIVLNGESYYATVSDFAKGLNFDDLLKNTKLKLVEYKKFGTALAELATDGKNGDQLKKERLNEPDNERLYARDIFKKIANESIREKLLAKEEEYYEILKSSCKPLYGSHEHGDPHGGNFFIHDEGITPIDLSGYNRTKGATGIMGNELYNALHAIVLYGLRYGKSLEELKIIQQAFYEGYTQRLLKKSIILSREVEEYYSLVWSGFLLYHLGDRLEVALDNSLLVRSSACIHDLSKSSRQLTDGLTLDHLTGHFFGKQKITVLTFNPSQAPHLSLVPSKTSAAAHPQMHGIDHQSAQYIDTHIGEGVPMKEIAKIQTDAIAVINGGFYQFSHSMYKSDQTFAKGDFVDYAKLRKHVFNPGLLPKMKFNIQKELEKAKAQPEIWEMRIKSLEDDLNAIQAQNPFEREIGWLVQAEENSPFEMMMADSLDAVNKLEKAKYAIPAKPVLIWDGEGSRIEQTSALKPSGEKKTGTPGNLDHLYEKAPRTIWAQDRQGQWLFVVIDGRQEEAVGMNFDEMVFLMKQLGAVRALNADGGGSSAMMVRKEAGGDPEFVTGILEKEKDRPIGNVLYLFNKNYPRPKI